MGEPGTSGDGGGAGSSGGATASTSAAGSSGAGEGPVCCSTADLDPAVVATMTADELKKFIDTGRTGRRNALPDVSEAGAITTSTAGVAEALEALSVAGTSGEKCPGGAAGGS